MPTRWVTASRSAAGSDFGSCRKPAKRRFASAMISSSPNSPSTRITLLRSSLIRVLGEFGDEEIIAEAKRRFAGFLQDPKSLPAALRDAVTHLVGITADRAAYDTLLALARKSTITNERLRYYFAAAGARDAALAQATLALTLTDEMPATVVSGVIGTVAGSGEQPDLAWDFVRANFDVLL